MTDPIAPGRFDDDDVEMVLWRLSEALRPTQAVPPRIYTYVDQFHELGWREALLSSYQPRFDSTEDYAPSDKDEDDTERITDCFVCGKPGHRLNKPYSDTDVMVCPSCDDVLWASVPRPKYEFPEGPYSCYMPGEHGAAVVITVDRLIDHSREHVPSPA